MALEGDSGRQGNAVKEGGTANTEVRPPSIALPKGGGAIRGIGEKFAANPVTGTGSLSIPIATSPGRSGFGPQLSLSYDSGAGNGPFGFGWSLSIPSITRKTGKGLPRYQDAEESDVFILSGAEDLAPVFRTNQAQDLVRDDKGNPIIHEDERDAYRVRRYRPRVEGLFARIERWTNANDPGDVHWRSISKDNILTLYGWDANSRIADPADARRIFSWLICETRDDKGNAVLYQYKKEDGSGADVTQSHERNRGDRNDPRRATNRYLKRIRYGNRASLLNNAGERPHSLTGDQIKDAGWMFEVVFDYGEHNIDAPKPGDAGSWAYRKDPFSSYRAGFEVRTSRRCQRVLMFHHFPGEADAGADCLVHSTGFTYSHQQDPVYTFLQAVSQSGYRRSGVVYQKSSLPPVEFEYTQPIVQSTVQEVDAASLENLPIGVDGSTYQWTDLHGEGIPGILTEQAGAWFYKRNISPIGKRAVEFAPLECVATKPNLALSGGQAQFMDLAGDGRPDLVVLDGPMPGLYEHDDDEGWQPFQPFTSRLNRDMRDPNLKFVDLDGDGHADVLIGEDDAIVWHASLAEQGFGPAQRVHQALDEEKGPRLVFADGTQSIYLADLSGDGLTDLARIRNGEVCYWPNLGYGRFGAKVTMDNAPHFDNPDQFDHKRIRLADIDGSGATDIIYLHRDGVHLYFNQSGNSWSASKPLRVFPRVDDLVSILTTDLLGNGTACLVWSSPLPGDARRPMRYVDLMGGQKPHLLIKTINNLGAETRVEYAPSTKFYLRDKYDGKPWITHLPFPVHVVERVETYDHISRNRFVTRYAYHHGYFDGEEREFRGFGMVEQWDTEELAALTGDGALPAATNLDTASHVPPVFTKTWFHTGVYLGRDHISDFFAGLIDAQDKGEYYRAPGLTDAEARVMLLPDTVLPAGLTLEEEREACRALKGTMLRQEVYAFDGTPKAAHPYSVTEQNFTIERLQSKGINRHGVFFTHAREAISYHYERNPADPRIGHSLVLDVDPFGNVKKSAAIGYGRRLGQSPLTGNDKKKQEQLLITYTESDYTENDMTNPADWVDAHRTPLPCEARTYELTGFGLAAGTVRFAFEDFAKNDFTALTSLNNIPYEAPVAPTVKGKRLIECVRTRYRRNDLTALLPKGTLQPLALPGESYKLAFTPGLLNVYAAKIAGADLQSILREEGRYVELDNDGQWWIPSGRAFYSTNEADTPAQELTEARAHFFLPRRYRDPFLNNTVVDYDVNDLLVTSTRDPIGNTVHAEINYRVLQPWRMTDPNGNQSEAAFDRLGLVVATAVIGKNGEGDLRKGFNTDLTQPELDAFFAAPRPPTPELLGKASTRIVYDVDRFHRTQQAHPADPAQWLPTYAATLARETHVSDLPANTAAKIQVSLSYSDGFGREIQKKIQAEKGPLHPGGADADPRWVGSGWTIFNNKGKPVRQYEPFFDDTHDFKFGKQAGVSPILFYDPVERVVATLHPNHTYEKVLFDPWRQTTYDVNDTVTFVPSGDDDVKGFFIKPDGTPRIPAAEYLPTWHAQRIGKPAGDPERDAARKAAAHGNTPTTAHFDSLGRPFLTLAHNGFNPDATPIHFATRVELDIEGNQREVRDAIMQNGDALGRVVMRYDYDMLGNRIHQFSMEAGARWMLNDVAGKPIRSWDSRNHQFRTAYDPLRRPTDSFLREGAGAELLVGRTVYGETRSNPEANNLRGKVIEIRDQAGLVTSDEYDFKGNLLGSQRQLAREYKLTLDWSTAVPPEADTYTSRTTYDALNRPVTLRTPDNSVIRPGYNEANLLERVDANLRGATAATPFVSNIDYDAKGQRMSIDYGNGVRTTYDYDPLTFRLVHLLTARNAFPGDCPQPPAADWPGCQVQNLHYTYDPVGNITHIRDDAQQAIYFRNKRVEPSAEYTYDAIYRLIEATGREHLGQVGGTPIPHSHDDAPRVGIKWSDNDGKAMGAYVESYVYDVVGNFMEMQHRGNDPANPRWTRSYAYSEASLIEPAKQSNRLSSTTVGNGNPITERYVYDTHGNITRMPHLGGAHPAANMHWDYRDQLRQADLGGRGTAYYVYDAAGQRVRKVWEKPANLIEERIYLGGFEIYRRRNGMGAVTLERETLHIMDDKQRIALVQTRTQGNDPAPEQLIRYQFGDHLGSAILELDDQAQIISYEEYTPYGSTSYQAVRSQTEMPKRYRYTGKERDEESGLYYHGARYYAAWLGRWVSYDPAQLVDGPNLYQYVISNPIRHSDPTGTEHLEQGTADDPVVMGCAGGECYMNIRQSRLEELQGRARVQQQLDTGAAIASNPFSPLFWGIARLFTDDPNKQAAAAQLGVAAFGVAAAGAGVAAGRQQMQSVATAQPERPAAAEVRAANPPATPTAPPPSRVSPTPPGLPLIAPPSGSPPPRPQMNVLVVGAETSGEFAYAQRISQQGGNATVVNPSVTVAARAYQQSGGNFVQGRVQDLPAGARFNLIREDYPFPLGRAFTPSQQFVEARLGRLTSGGTWVVVTESSEFVQALEAAGTYANARFTVNQIPQAHEATPQSSYPREQNRFAVTFSR